VPADPGPRISDEGFDGSRIPDPGTISVFRECIIGKAVQPAFSRLRRCDNRMVARSRVSARVTVWRRIAAERHAARLTGSQMHPARPHLDAFLAFLPGGVSNGVDGFDVQAGGICHRRLFK